MARTFDPVVSRLILSESHTRFLLCTRSLCLPRVGVQEQPYVQTFIKTGVRKVRVRKEEFPSENLSKFSNSHITKIKPIIFPGPKMGHTARGLRGNSIKGT